MKHQPDKFLEWLQGQTTTQLAQALDMKDAKLVNRWRREECRPSMAYAPRIVRLAGGALTLADVRLGGAQ